MCSGNVKKGNFHWGCMRSSKGKQTRTRTSTRTDSRLPFVNVATHGCPFFCTFTELNPAQLYGWAGQGMRAGAVNSVMTACGMVRFSWGGGRMRKVNSVCTTQINRLYVQVGGEGRDRQRCCHDSVYIIVCVCMCQPYSVVVDIYSIFMSMFICLWCWCFQPVLSDLLVSVCAFLLLMFCIFWAKCHLRLISLQSSPSVFGSAPRVSFILIAFLSCCPMYLSDSTESEILEKELIH